MATHRAALSARDGDFAALLLAQREVAPRAEVIANEAAGLLRGCAINVYLYDERQTPAWSVKATVGEVTVEHSYHAATLERLALTRESVLSSGGSLAREHYAHLDVRRTIASLAYVPILLEDDLLGAIEAISFERALAYHDIQSLQQLTELSALALSTGLAYENERNSSLNSITRLTQLYDVEKVFNSTLQMGELMPIICAKVRELLNTQAVNLYMVSDEDLVLMARDGQDDTVEMEALGGEIIQSIGNSGEAVLIAEASDPRLVQRNGERTDGRIVMLMAAPVIEGGDTLTAVLECVNRTGGAAFDEDDLFFLTMMAQTASGALHNASLMEAEKKIEVLETLVAVSGEITSTLNLERVLQVVVNGPRRIMSYDRAAIALQQRGRLQLKAVSGKTEIVASEPAMRLLRETLEFCSISDQEMYVVVRDGKVQASRQETRAEFARYFQQSGSRAWYAIPLQDDEGRLGILSFESRNPDFLTETHLELIKVVAAQATVALRNASLYTEVPFIGVLEPLLQKKQRFMRMGRNRRAALAGVAIAAALFLAVFPLPMRLDGSATVAPLRTAQIQTEMDGVVRAVHVREGDLVKRGTTLAELDDWDYRSALAGAQAKYQQALSQMNRALATNDGTEAGVQRVQAEYWQGEVQRARERLEHTRLRSPIDGVVTTPHIEDLVGHKLDAGANFAQVVDSSRASIDVAVDQDDLGLVRTGESAVMKLDGFPTRKFRGRVAIVSPLATVEGDRRVFMARVEVMNEDGLIRAGMQGKGKVFAGWRPAGYVLFRGMGIWLWTKLWSWFGW